MHIVLSIPRTDLNQKTLVRQEYDTGFVDCRYANSWASYHTVCTTGYYRQEDDFAVYCEVDAPNV